jgi:hypothetical protein
MKTFSYIGRGVGVDVAAGAIAIFPTWTCTNDLKGNDKKFRQLANNANIIVGVNLGNYMIGLHKTNPNVWDMEKLAYSNLFFLYFSWQVAHCPP